MKPYHEAPGVTLYLGDCIEVMAAMPEASVDAIVCDPPYGLEFMGKGWDKFRTTERTERWSGERSGGAGSGLSDLPRIGGARVSYGGQRPTTSRCRTCNKRDAFRNDHACGDDAEWVTEPVDPDAAPPSMVAFQNWTSMWAREARRVLKPGGHLLAFGGPRTYHRLASGIEDAGFELRDCVMWMYGSGFPKSLDVSKALDDAAGVVRPDRDVSGPADNAVLQPTQTVISAGTPVTELAIRYDGWGTALKPAYEPVVVARVPLAGTVAANVAAYGTGGLNIDAGRIEGKVSGTGIHHKGPGGAVLNAEQSGLAGEFYYDGTRGRWPANIVMDEEAAALLDEQTDFTSATSGTRRVDRSPFSTGVGELEPVPGYGDSGGPSRFFYTAKTSRAEREAGLDGHEAQVINEATPPGTAGSESPRAGAGRGGARRNVHPTVKPVDLMRWLVSLVLPLDGVILDPFNGSGSTGMATLDLHGEYIGIDLDADYLDISIDRIEHRHMLADPEDVQAATAGEPQPRML